MTIVVDASVAVKWFITEPGSEAAAKLLDGDRPLVAPSLIRIEVSNAILRHYRESEISERRARESIDLWHDMLAQPVMQLVPEPDIYSPAIELAFRTRHTVPDCLYLALAIAFDAEVITADGPMKQRGDLVHPKISFLEGCGKN